MNKIIFYLLLTMSLITNAQDVEMADTFREDGKIYVVVGVVLLVLAGLIVYMIKVENRIKKLEKNKGI